MLRGIGGGPAKLARLGFGISTMIAEGGHGEAWATYAAKCGDMDMSLDWKT